MNVLTAHTPNGYLHAVTLDSPAGFGLGFERTMTRMGLTVQRRPLAEHLEQQRQMVTAPKPSQNAQNPAPTQAMRSLEHENALPELGQRIVQNIVGYATVTHFVTTNGQRVPVATGPRGSGLVKPGQWRPATAADVPMWLREREPVKHDAEALQVEPTCQEIEHVEADMSPEVPADRHDAGTCTETRHEAVSTPVDSPAPNAPVFQPGDWIRQYPGGQPHVVGSKGSFTRCGLGIRQSAGPMGELGKLERKCGHCLKAEAHMRGEQA